MKQEKNLEQLTLRIIENGLSSGSTDCERIRTVGVILEQAAQLREEYSDVCNAICTKYDHLREYSESEATRLKERVEFDKKNGFNYVYEEIHRVGHVKKTEIYRQACEVLMGERELDSWKVNAEQLDQEAWDEVKLERCYKIF